MRAHALLLALLLPLPLRADMPPEVPRLDRPVSILTGHPVWPGRVWLKWRLTDGRTWCTYFDRNVPASGGWVPVELFALTVPAPASLSFFERCVCGMCP